jgi:hypothetical protein
MSTGGQPGGDSGGGGGQAPAVPWGVDPAAAYNIGDKPWYEVALPDGPAKQLIAEKKYANPTVLANSYYEANRALSAKNADNSVIVPGDNATDADRNAFYTKLGRPPDPTGYKDTVVWGDNPDPQMQEFASKLAFDLGLSPKQTSTLVSRWNTLAGEMETKGAEAYRTNNESEVASLKATWGKDFEPNIAAGQRVLNSLKGNGLSEDDLSAIEANVGAAPVIKLLATIGKLTGEASFMQGAHGALADPNNMTPEQAAAEVTRLRGDADFNKMYTDAKHPQHKDAVDRMAALFVKGGDKIIV